MSEQSLLEIKEGCIQGKRQFQKQLYEHLHGKMLGICMRYSKDRSEAKDIFHEAMLKVFRSLEQHDPKKGKLEVWVSRIMVNTAIDSYRKQSRSAHTIDIDEASETYVDEESFSQLSVQELMSLVQRLSPAYKLVFNLYAIEGYTHPEIAKRLGISEGTSKSNLSKARKNLQQMLGKLTKDKAEVYVR